MCWSRFASARARLLGCTVKKDSLRLDSNPGWQCWSKGALVQTVLRVWQCFFLLLNTDKFSVESQFFTTVLFITTQLPLNLVGFYYMASPRTDTRARFFFLFSLTPAQLCSVLVLVAGDPIDQDNYMEVQRTNTLQSS